MYQLSEDLKNLVSHIRMQIVHLKQENERLLAECVFLRNAMLEKESLLEDIKKDVAAMQANLDDNRESELLAKMMLEEVATMFKVAMIEEKSAACQGATQEVLHYELC